MTSASIGYGNFIEITASNSFDTVIYRFQNYFVQEQKTFLGDVYDWLPFQVAESENSTEGDNTSASIALPNNVLALQVVNGNDGLRGQQIVINTVYINPLTGDILTGGRNTNLYTVDGSVVREEVIQVECQGIVNALLDTFPRTRFTERNVGKLPQNAQLRFV